MIRAISIPISLRYLILKLLKCDALEVAHTHRMALQYLLGSKRLASEVVHLEAHVIVETLN